MHLNRIELNNEPTGIVRKLQFRSSFNASHENSYDNFQEIYGSTQKLIKVTKII